MTARPHPQAALFDGIPDELIQDFAAVRKVKKAPITATAINGIKREAAKAGMTLEAAITMCIERNWQSIRAEWVLRENDEKKTSGAPWWSSDAAILAKGVSMKIIPRPGETMFSLKGRIQGAIDNGGSPPPQQTSRISTPAEQVRGKRPDVPALASLVRKVAP